MGNQWPLRCHVCASFAEGWRDRNTIGSPRYARTNGVPGSPCTLLENSCDGSGLFANRTDSGSTRKANPPPMVASPPFRNVIGDLFIFWRYLADGVPSTDGRPTIGLSAEINSAARGFESIM